MNDFKNEMRFDERVAVVTGAGRGLGRRYALLLAARVPTSSSTTSAARWPETDRRSTQRTREITDAGGSAVPDVNTVATPQGGQAIIDTALSNWGRVDILVNNAGTVGDAAFDEMTDDRLSPLLDVHLKGAFFVTRPAWRAMRAAGYGRIINTCSAAGLLGAERMSNYGAAKMGVVGLTRVLAAESAGLDMMVNAIALIAATRMLDYSMNGVAALDDPVVAAAAEEVMRPFLDRLYPALVGPVVAYLAHDECPVSGEIYTVGAGQVARLFIGRTKGYYHPSLTVEDVRAHFEEIRSTNDFTVPADSARR